MWITHGSFPAKAFGEQPCWGSPQIITNHLEQLGNGGPFIQQQLETPVGDEERLCPRWAFYCRAEQVFAEWVNEWMNEYMI